MPLGYARLEAFAPLRAAGSRQEVVEQALATLGVGEWVVEIGTLRFLPGTLDSIFDGMMTLYLAKRCRELGLNFRSVDINRACVDMARDELAKMGMLGLVAWAEGTRFLKAFPAPISLLYLDGGNSPDEALAQFRAAKLAPEAWVIVDDCCPNALAPDMPELLGKGAGVILDAAQHGWDVELVDVPYVVMGVLRRSR